MLTSAMRGETLTLTLRVQFYANEWNQWGAAPTYTIYTRGGGQLPNPKNAIIR